MRLLYHSDRRSRHSLCWPAVPQTRSPFWRRSLPWVVSAGALAYVFAATDWRALLEATEGANLPLFVAYTTVDKLIFFLWWGILQAAAVRRFVAPISTRSVVALRGGAELLRAINNPVADAGFLYGMAQLTRGHLASIVAAVGVPLACHCSVLLLQASLSMFFLDGGPLANRGVLITVGVGWTVVACIAASVRLGLWTRLLETIGLAAWLRNVELRSLLPFVGWFALLAAFDVLIQGLAARAFGVVIDWWALAARIPILYLALSLPSFANYGTRELAWATSFSEFAPRETLLAYALATNTVFLLLHVVIGVIFLPRAIALITEMRRARRAGERLPAPLLHDASDP